MVHTIIYVVYVYSYVPNSSHLEEFEIIAVFDDLDKAVTQLIKSAGYTIKQASSDQAELLMTNGFYQEKYSSMDVLHNLVKNRLELIEENSVYKIEEKYLCKSLDPI